VKKIGAGRARRVLLSGGVMSGQHAFDIGMVDRVVPTLADLDAACAEMAARLASGGPQALRATKALLNEIDGSTDAATVMRGAELSANVIALPSTRETLRAKLAR
jgi:enoyl-CoA hydratase/carnithine racemase